MCSEDSSSQLPCIFISLYVCLLYVCVLSSHLLALVNHYLSLRYGSRPIVLVGAIGSCISLLVAAYSPNIALWVVAIGLGVGKRVIGIDTFCSLLYSPVSVHTALLENTIFYVVANSVALFGFTGLVETRPVCSLSTVLVRLIDWNLHLHII